MHRSHHLPATEWFKILGAMFVVVLCLMIPFAAQGQKTRSIALLPFTIHAPQPLEHLKQDLQEMLAERLAGHGYTLVKPEEVNRHPLAFKPLLRTEEIRAIGAALKADLVVTGSLTQIGKRISLDIKALEVEGEAVPFSIFMVEDDIDKLADAVDKAAKSLDNLIAGIEQIESLQVKGNRRVESEAILAVLESKKGDSIDKDRLDQDLRAVYRMGFFRDVNVEVEDGPKGKIVTFSVTEKPSIRTITFKGNKKVKSDDLKKEAGIKPYAILNHGEITQSINRMKEYYKQKGYYTVQIKEKIEELPENEVALIYEIEEGKKVFITKIDFVGNEQFSDDDLQDQMETSERGLFSFLTGSGILDKKMLEFDLLKVTSFYHNLGYIRAKTGEPKISYEEEGGLTITVEVIEGDQYAVNNVKIEGDLIKPVDELLEKIGINKEKFFNREVVSKDTMTLRETYADEGYAYADVAPLVKEDDEKKWVDITYRISRGNKVRFERINITGNSQTRDHVLRRELEVVEGGYFSGEAMRKSTRNLHRLGYFEDLEIQTIKGSQDDLMVLDIKVKERPTGTFSFGIGYSSFENIVGIVSVDQNNLFGKGQKISASAKMGSRTSEFTIDFTEPWFLNRRISANFELYNWEVEYDEYNKDSMGAGVNFRIPLGIDDFTRGIIGYKYDDSDITDIADTAALAIKDMAGRNVTSSMRFGLDRDSRDRAWNPTKGSVNSVTFEYAGGPLGGDVYFNRYEASSSWYFSMFWDTVFMIQGKGGYIEAREGRKLPIYQKYKIGGINTVRGFDFYSISPIDPATGDRIGGEKMMVYNVEYRYPLLKEQGVVGVVFFDAGNVFEEDEKFTFKGIRKSVGAGVRWYSPLGPLRIEYGMIIGPRGEEPSGNWEFAMGGMW